MENKEEKYIDFNLYQRLASRTALYEDRMYPVCSLMVEAAELADLFIKPILRGDAVSVDRAKVISGAGDVLWNLAMILDDMQIDFEKVAKANVEKLKKRLEDGTIQGRGDR